MKQMKMNDVSSRINERLYEHKWYKRLTAITIVMSMLCAFFVPLDLGMPGAAMSVNIDTLGTTILATAGNAWFDDVQTTPLGDNLSGKITKVSITSGDKTFDGTPIIIDAKDADPLMFKMNLSYNYDGAQLKASGILDSHCVYYQIPENTVKVRQAYFGSEMKVTDSAWNEEVPSGYYSISEDGLVVIRFTDDYITYLENSPNGFKGAIEFNAKAERADNEDGDRTFTIEGTEIEIKFDDDVPTMSKDGRANVDENGSPYIQWAITINNPNGHIDLSEYTLTDGITEKEGENTSTVNWGNITEWSVTPEGAAEKSENGFTLNGNAQQVTITYKEPAVSGREYSNEAKLQKGDNTPITAKKEVIIENALEASKSGTPDYKLPGKGEGKKIQWTIDVRNKAGESLDKTNITDSNFPADVANITVYAFDANNQKTTLSEGVELSDNVLTLTGNIPSHVQIVYETDANGYDVATDNSCTVQSTKDNPPDPDNDNTASVTYQHQYSMEKSCSQFNTETDMLQWKIKVWAGDGSGSATLNGYKITDDAIKGLIYSNNEPNGNKISFNAFTNGEAVSISDKVELVKAADSDEVTIKLKDADDTTPISVIEVFYQQTVQANLNDDTKYADYLSGKNTTVRNEASGKMSGTDKTEDGVGERTEHKVVGSNKSYLSNSEERVVGNADKKDRTLTWKIEVENDSGIGNDSKALTDILQDDNGGKHYIKPSQVSDIKVTGKQTKNGEVQEIDPSAYTIKFYDASGNEITNFANSDQDAVHFEVVFNHALDNIRHLYIEYKTTADVSGVENGNIAHFNNQLTYEGEPKTTNGLTFNREDPNQVKNITLNVNKTWDDRKDRAGKRPESYKIQVWQAEADENGNPPAADSAAWKEYGAPITIASTATGDQLLGSDYPQWVVNKDEDGIESVVRYCYKITEVTDSESDYYVSSISEPFVAKTDNQTMRLTNKLDAEADKTAIDKTYKEIKDIDLSKVPKGTINISGIDTECYIFGWLVYLKDYDPTNRENNRYTDTLPNSAIYITGSVGNDWTYQPKVLYGENGNVWDLGDGTLAASVSGNTLSFEVKRDDLRAFRYFTAIPKNQIDAALQSGLLINTVKLNNEEKEYQATLEVNKDIADDTQHLEKGNIPVIVGGVAKYYLDVNPTGKKLSNEDYINITDELYYHQESAKKNLKIVLDDIKVYPYENGAVNKLAPIQDFSYTVDYDYTDSSDLTYSGPYQTSDNKQFWYIEGWKPGQTITIKTNQNSEITDKTKKPYIYVYSGDVDPNDLNQNKLNDGDSNWGNPIQFSNYNDDGEATVTFTASQNAKKIIVVSEAESIEKTRQHEGFLIDDSSKISVTSNGQSLTLLTPQEGTLDGNRVKYWEVTGWQYGNTIKLSTTINDSLVNSGKKVYLYMYTADNFSENLAANRLASQNIQYNGNAYYYTNLFYSEASSNGKSNFETEIIIPDPNYQANQWAGQNPEVKHIIVACDYATKEESYTVKEYPTDGTFTGYSQSPSIPVLLNVSVPDQQHYRIEYSYRVTGYTPDTSEVGQQSNGDSIFFNNKARFEADNGSGEDSKDKVQLNVKNSGATSEATKFPKIYKVDVNNYSLNNLNASFKVAKWVPGETGNPGKWVYASKIEDQANSGKTIRTFTFPTIGNEETVTGDKHYAPTGDAVAVLKFAADDDASTANDSENLHEFNLDTATLYKFVEIEAPGEYKQPVTNGSLEDNQEFVYYYAYNGYENDPPPDAVDENGRSLIRNIVVNGTVNIPNSKDITLKAQKMFTGKEEDLPDKADVTLKLYYSTNRAGTNLKAVTSDMLVTTTDDSGNDIPFNNPVTLIYEKGKTEPIAEWTQLPSGMNGIPIYYFVQEEQVVITKTENEQNVTKTYTLDTESGKFMSGNEVCPFQPVYTRNGTNQDGTVIQVNNSEGILVKKTWLNASGRTVPAPKEPGSNESMKIAFEVYGILNGYRVKLDLRDETARANTESPQPTLNGDNGYKLLLPDPVGLLGVTSNSIKNAISYEDGKTYALSEFTSFDIEEKLTPAQIQEMYGKYGNPQTTRMVQNGTGVLEMINTDLRSDTVDVDVTKLWDDDNLSHNNESITVKLIQSTHSNLNAEQLDSHKDDAVQSTSKVKLILKNTAQEFSFNKNIKEVKAKDEGWNCSIDNSDKKKFTLSGHAVGSTVLTVTFEDDTTEEMIVTVIDNYTQVLSNSNNWKYKWEKLPAVADDGATYYYYVIEQSVPDGYEAVYSKSTTNNEQSLTVTNRLPTKLTLQKKWYDSSGSEITNISDNAAIPDKIRVEVYQKPLTEEVITGDDVPKPNNFKVVALGDSITLGSYNGIEQQYRYPDRLQAKLQSGGFASASVLNHGVNSNEIDDMRSRLSSIDFNGVNGVLILAGTNDVMHGKSEGAVDRYKQLIDEVFAKAQAAGTTNFRIYAATIPYITKLEWFAAGTSQAQANTLVNNFNTGITNLIDGNTITIPEGYGIVKVDVNSAVKVIDENGNEVSASETMLKDQCHPNEKGYEEIAKTFYSSILSQYTTATITTVTNPTDVNLPNADYNINNLASGTLYGTYDVEKSKGFTLDLMNLPKENALGQKYVYYIREVGTHVLNENNQSYRLSEGAYKYIAGVQYVDNGKIPSATAQTITIKNTIQTTQLTVSKDWSDGNEKHVNDAITVRIHRDTVADSAAAQKNPLTLTLSKSEVTVYRGYEGYSETLTASVPVKPLTDAMLNVTLDSSGKRISVNSKADTEETIVTVGDRKMIFETEDGQRAELTVHIVEKPALTLELDKYSVIGGQDVPVVKSVTLIDDTDVTGQATYSSDNSSVISITENGTMTVNGVGTATITATYDNKRATKDVTVSYSDDFTVTNELNITTGTEASLGIDPYFGTFTYNITPAGDSPTDGLTVADGKVTANKEGTYTVTVTRSDDKTHDVVVNVIEGTKTGKVVDKKSNDISYDYTYDPVTNKITVTVSRNKMYNSSEFNPKFENAEDDAIKNLIPIKYEVVEPSDATNISMYLKDWKDYDNKYDWMPGEKVATCNDNTKAFSAMTGDDGIAFGTDGTYTIVITVKSANTDDSSGGDSGESGNADNETIVNKPFSQYTDGKVPISGTIEIGSKVSIKLKGTAYKGYKINLGGYNSDAQEWKNLNGDDGYQGSLNENGEATIEITVQYTITNSEIQSWYDEGGDLQLYSYTITPPATANANSVNNAPKLTRFNATSLRMSSAKKLAGQMNSGLLSAQSAVTEEENTQLQTDGYFDRTIGASDSWQISLSDLPMYYINNGSVETYYYWAEEIEGNSGYITSYSFTDADENTDYSINASKSGEAAIRITNTLNQIPESVELPESGSTGTRIYYTIGGILLLLSTAGYVTAKRRRWSDG